MNVEEIFFDISYFKINKLLSKGNFANYYIAKNQETNTKYVAKIYIIDDQISYSDQIDVLREAMILNKLHHPSIIQFYGVNFQSFSDPSQIKPSIILKHYPNGSLRHILEKERQGNASSKWNTTKKYINILGIAHAMKIIHNEGIIHRNLKPENVLLDKNFYPIISDFILSRVFPFPLDKSFQIPLANAFGTPLYMAPELTFEEEYYGIGVDVYAFSIIAYEILTGKMPGYETGLSFSILHADRPFYRPRFVGNVAPKMKDLITKCGSSWVEERPSFDEIYQELSNDFAYYSGDFDEQEIKNYINFIENENSQFEEEEDEACINEENDEISSIGFDEDENYETVCKIYEDNSSITYKIVEQQTKKPLFKKILKAKCENMKNIIDKFKIYHSLNHPCVCQAIGMNIENEENNPSVTFYYEYVDFKLKDCLNCSLINNTLKMRIVIEILHGMIYLQQNCLFFGNFSIDCIMLNSIFHAKILNCDAIQNDGNISYSSAFTSPEIIDKKEFDYKSDVYSFGVIMYCIFIEMPQGRIDANSIRKDQSMNQCFFDLLSKCLSRDPKDRPSFEYILKYLREYNYLISNEIDSTIVSQRDQGLGMNN